jgi:Tfp pilus assembly protein PilF
MISFTCDIRESLARDRSFYANELKLAKQAAAKGDYVQARSLFEKITQKAPHNSYVNYALGRVLLLYPRNSTEKKDLLLKKKEITLAIQLLSKSVQQDPASGQNLFYLAFAYYFGGYRDLAFSTFQKTVKLDPKYYQAYFNMGVIKEEQNEVFASQKYFELYLARLKGEKTQTQFEDF